ncbi:DUF4236 domain-containing protein [Sutterella sp.]|uniref:DUF4236 domain-containing protein n=1 Tax=Sutterella sp. TaxID=1981025 RepID=UPI0026DFD724|nr:DUF4236 domain-containing protein [Sutterella sp.]MDO5532829.1 DUF4236 domain-containing protein [Sutterella sp.]
MGLRINKSFRLGSLLKVNLSKTGLSVTVGKPGLSVNVGKKGATGNVGIPGSGVSYRTKIKPGGILDKIRQKIGL